MKKIVLSIFMIGFGTLAMAQKSPEQKANRDAKLVQSQAKLAEKRAADLEKMKTELDLNAAQLEKVKASQEKMAVYRRAEREKQIAVKKETIMRMKEQRELMNAEMKNILTQEQFSKWEAKREQRKGKMKNAKKTRMNKRNKMNNATT